MNTTKITLKSLSTGNPIDFEFFPVDFQYEDYLGLDVGGELIGIFLDIPKADDADTLADMAHRYLFVHEGDYYHEVARETTDRVLIIADDADGHPVYLNDTEGEFLEVRSGDTFIADDGEVYIATRCGWTIDTPVIREATIDTYGEILSHSST